MINCKSIIKCMSYGSLTGLGIGSALGYSIANQTCSLDRTINSLITTSQKIIAYSFVFSPYSFPENAYNLNDHEKNNLDSQFNNCLYVTPFSFSIIGAVAGGSIGLVYGIAKEIFNYFKPALQAQNRT